MTKEELRKQFDDFFALQFPTAFEEYQKGDIECNLQYLSAYISYESAYKKCESEFEQVAPENTNFYYRENGANMLTTATLYTRKEQS